MKVLVWGNTEKGKDFEGSLVVWTGSDEQIDLLAGLIKLEEGTKNPATLDGEEVFAKSIFSYRMIESRDVAEIVLSQPEESLNLKEHLEREEKRLVLSALVIADFSQAEAARILGVSAKHVFDLIVRHKITHKRWKRNVEGKQEKPSFYAAKKKNVLELKKAG